MRSRATRTRDSDIHEHNVHEHHRRAREPHSTRSREPHSTRSRELNSTRSREKNSTSGHTDERRRRKDKNLLTLTPTPYQENLARYLLHDDSQRLIACWQMGVGKTPLAILFFESHLITTKRPLLCIVVASPTIQSNFKSNLFKFGKTQEHVDRFYRFWSYDLIAFRPEEFATLVKDNLVVCDEIHDIRSVITTAKHNSDSDAAVGTADHKKPIFWDNKRVKQGSQAAACLIGLRGAYKVLGLTGTVIYNSLSDLYNMAWFVLNNGRDPKAQERLEYFKANVKVAELKKNTMSSTTRAIFEQIFKGKISVQTIESCGLAHKFPRVNEIQVLIEMNSEYYDAYRCVEMSQIEELRKKKETKLLGSGAFWSGLRQAANKINSVESQKRQFILKLVHQAKARGERVSITSTFLSRGVGLLIKSFHTEQIRFVEISGDISVGAERQRAIDAFNDPRSSLDVIILSGAGTTGINLTRARRQINMESSWNSATRHQTNSRVARLGSAMSEVTIYNLLMVKPGAIFDEVVQEMRDVIDSKQHGAPTDVMIIRSTEQPNDNQDIAHNFSRLSVSISADGDGKESKEDAEMTSIDVHLFRLQLSKSKAFQRVLTQDLPEWSIECHPAWQEILGTCPPLIVNPTRNEEKEERPERERKERSVPEPPEPPERPMARSSQRSHHSRGYHGSHGARGYHEAHEGHRSERSHRDRNTQIYPRSNLRLDPVPVLRSLPPSPAPLRVPPPPRPPRLGPQPLRPPLRPTAPSVRSNARFPSAREWLNVASR